MTQLNPEHVAWSRQLFNTLSDGGAWAIPRSGLIFNRRGSTLALVASMPHEPSMPLTAAQLLDQQQRDFNGVKDHFGAAGVTVTDERKPDGEKHGQSG